MVPKLLIIILLLISFCAEACDAPTGSGCSAYEHLMRDIKINQDNAVSLQKEDRSSQLLILTHKFQEIE